MRASFPSLNGSGDSFQVFVVLEGDLALSQYLAEALAGLWSRTGARCQRFLLVRFPGPPLLCG